MNGLEGAVLWLLLPIAVVAAWIAGRQFGTSEKRSNSSQFSRSDYFKGINYLINEQPDRAIETFIRVLEIDSETVETHLALGSLYRRRGEVNRAILIHQNLVARDSLLDSQRSEGLLELARDYLSAGLLDRAEELFIELADTKAYRVQALRQLIDVYEQEKDWTKAIPAAKKLEKITANPLGTTISHYYCQQAEQELSDNDPTKSLKLTQQALRVYDGCVRASLLEARIQMAGGQYQQAIVALRRVEKQDPIFLSETVDLLIECYRALDRITELGQYLSYLIERYGWVTAVLALTDLKHEHEGSNAAITFIAKQLRCRVSVRGLDRWIDIAQHNSEQNNCEHLDILKSLTAELLTDRSIYQCSNCGFPTLSLHWQCPGCKHWSTIRPIQGVQGE